MSDDMLERFTEAVLGAIDYGNDFAMDAEPEILGKYAARVAKAACEEVVRLKIEELKEDHEAAQWSPFKRPGQGRPPEAQPLTEEQAAFHKQSQEQQDRWTLEAKVAPKPEDVPTDTADEAQG